MENHVVGVKRTRIGTGENLFFKMCVAKERMCCNWNQKTENWRFSSSSFILCKTISTSYLRDSSALPPVQLILEKTLHNRFHEMYNFGGNTLDQFLDFLMILLSEQQKKISMPISSQANPEGLEGSETRAYDPDRVMKLHERLASLSFLKG